MRLDIFEKLALLGSNIFTGRNTGGITDAQNRDAVGQGLTAAGLRTILASQPGAGPGGAAPTALGAIAQGALAGQEAGGRSRATAARQNALSGADLTSAEGIAQILPAFLNDPDMFGELVKLQGQLATTPTQPDRVDLGDRIVFYDPDDPSKIIETMLKTPEAGPAANALATAYDRASSDDITRARAAASMLDAVRDPSAAGDIALVFAFMKSQDPASSVREGEAARVDNAAGVPAQIRNLYNRLIKGETLAPGVREDLLETMRQNINRQRNFVDQNMNRFRIRAEAQGVDPDLILWDPYAPLDDFLRTGEIPPPSSPRIRAGTDTPPWIVPGQTINPGTGLPYGTPKPKGNN